MTVPSPAVVRIDGPWRHRDIRANGIKLHIVECGPDDPDAPLVVLLHGFADSWLTWRHQLPLLREAGLRAVAVDLRGYGDSDKPPRGYDGWTLAGDVGGLIRALGHTDATIVGHAEGGLVARAMAVIYPRIVRSLVLIASPHPSSLRHAVLTRPAQARAFLPAFLRHQPPFLPERRLVRHEGAAVEQLLGSRSSSTWRDSTGFREAAERMRTAIRIDGVAHCTLEFQRWAFRSRFRPDGHRFLARMKRSVTVPAVHLHGLDDPFILTRTIDSDTRWIPGIRVTHYPDTGHWVHLERPDEVAARIVEAAATAP